MTDDIHVHDDEPTSDERARHDPKADVLARADEVPESPDPDAKPLEVGDAQ